MGGGPCNECQNIPRIYLSGSSSGLANISTICVRGCVPDYHRCQHQRSKKRDRADEKAGVIIFPPPGRATGNYTDFARATIQPRISLSRARTRALPVWYGYVAGRFDLCVTFIT